MHGGRRERTRGPRPQGGGGCNLRGEGGGVVTRVLQGLHTLHTFFREKGREVSQVFFFFSFLREKKNLRPTPWDFALAEACKPCKVCNPKPTSRPQAPGCPPTARATPSARPPPPRRACARPARARARARARVGGARFKLGVRLGLQTAPDPNPNPGRLVAPAGLGGRWSCGAARAGSRPVPLPARSAHAAGAARRAAGSWLGSGLGL